jgi:hypothetical protein
VFLLVFAVIACHTSGDPSEAGPLASKRVALIPETAAAVGAELRSLVASGKLKGLRWPEFRDVSGDTLKFYAGCGYGPAWVDGVGATAEAKVVVSSLQKSAQKGLNAEDYDASPPWSKVTMAYTTGMRRCEMRN